ncbi:hypothetical protein DFJ74DRAFT_663259 [Hyaloraphidium curvatum]|nr:hypothetical protein DFJ74DRAFT_663259 [Hyaloraphidium curvatum]
MEPFNLSSDGAEEHSHASQRRIPSLRALTCASLAPYLDDTFPYECFDVLPWDTCGALLFAEARQRRLFAWSSRAAAAFERHYGARLPRSFFSLAVRDMPVSSTGTALHSGASFSREDAQIALRVRRVSGLVHLKRLELRNANLKDADMPMLCQLVKLELLDLAGNVEVSDLGFGTLARATSAAAGKRPFSELEEEDLDDFSDGPRGLSKLQYLNLSGTGITDHSIPLIRRFPALLAIDLSRTYVSYGDGIKPLLKNFESGWLVLDPAHSIFPESDPQRQTRSWWNPTRGDPKEKGEAMVRKFLGAALVDPTTDIDLTFAIQGASLAAEEHDEDLRSYVLGGASTAPFKGRWENRRYVEDEKPGPRPVVEQVWVAGTRNTVRTVRREAEGAEDPFERTFRDEDAPVWREKSGRTLCFWRIARKEVPVVEEVQVRSRGFGVHQAAARPVPKPEAKPAHGMKDHTGRFEVHARLATVTSSAKRTSPPGSQQASQASNPFPTAARPGNPFAGEKPKGLDVDQLLKDAERENQSKWKKANRGDWTKGWSK